MSKHTPGPWYVTGDFVNFEYTDPSGNRCSGTIAEVALRGETKFANARLIAAAPELLEACKALLALLDEGDCDNHDCDTCELLKPAKAAIAKAEGGQ